MKRFKQVFAILLCVILVGLYVATLIAALLDHSDSAAFFKASIYATVCFPVLIWAYASVYRWYKKKDQDQE